MIIGISGKKQVGKDTIGKIIQSLDWYYNGYKNNIREKYSDIEYITKVINNEILEYSDWQIRKFADKLKDIVCLLIGCTREQLEDRDFKEKELGEEWWYVKLDNKLISVQEYIDYIKGTTYSFNEKDIIKLTPRKLLQLLGTECGRNIIHPNIWVNALIADYRSEYIGSNYYDFEYPKRLIDSQYKFWLNNPDRRDGNQTTIFCKEVYPFWCITDVRFPNELQAIKDRDGIIIRVNRSIKIPNEITETAFGKNTSSKIITINFNEHSSETALDNAEFDYVIDNNGTIEELIEKVRQILVNEKII